MIADLITRQLCLWFSFNHENRKLLDQYISERNPKNQYDIERLTKEFEHKYSQGIYR